MDMPLPEIIDRITIVRLKMERIGDPMLRSEYTALEHAIKEVEYKGFTINPDWIERLYKINGEIWDLESDIRAGKEGELGLEEVGRRAIIIREKNKVRVGIKNEIVKATGKGFEDVKMNHASAEQKVLTIVIPVYNEKRYFLKIMKEVMKANTWGMRKQIIIVESNSTDGTREIVKKFVLEQKKNFDIELILEDKPQGKGHAVKAAFKKIRGDIVLVQDADLEYKPSEYEDLLKPILDGKCDFVLGSRSLGKKHWEIRDFEGNRFYSGLLNFGGLFFTGIFNILYNVKLTDPATMFKVFKYKCMKGITWKSDWFELDWEIIAKFIRNGHIPIEVPVSYNSRSTKEGKKIRFFRDGPRVFWAILKYRFVN